MTDDVSCPHCTYLNPCTRVRCRMCLKQLRTSQKSTQATASVTLPPGADPVDEGVAFKRARLEQSKEQGETALTAPCDNVLDEVAKALNGTSPETSSVSTLFCTAAGKPVAVTARSLREAHRMLQRAETSEEKSGGFQEPSAPGPTNTDVARPSGRQTRSVGPSAYVTRSETDGASSQDAERQPIFQMSATLFSTAGGTPIAVSEESVHKARLFMNRLAEEMNEDDEPHGDDRSSETVPPTVTPVRVPQEEGRSSVSSTNDAGPPHGSATPVSFRSGSRKVFVPPQRVVPSARKAPTRASGPAPAQQRPTTLKFRLLSFDPMLLSSDAHSSMPTLEEIMSDAFAFRRENCSAPLAEALGLSSRDSVVTTTHWQHLLMHLGAVGSYAPLLWCEHMLKSSLIKIRHLSLATATEAAHRSALDISAVAMCLCHRYNTEVVEGERPALRKLTEGDVPPASLMVLYVSMVTEERTMPHTCIVRVSDGYYHLKAIFDVPLTNLIREGALRTGQKIALCGSKLLLHNNCSPLECVNQAVLSVNYNCVRAVAADTLLGLCYSEPASLPIPLIHPLGGLVPALEGVVSRVLPPFFVLHDDSNADQQHKSASSAPSGVKVVRNLHAHLQYCERMQSAAQKVSPTGVNSDVSSMLPMPRFSRVTSILLLGDGGEAFIQQWEACEGCEAALSEESAASLPPEGSSIVVYALNPSKSRTAAAPFSRAKLFYSSRMLHYRPLKKPISRRREVHHVLGELQGVTIGSAVDLVGLFLGMLRTEQVFVALLLLEQDTYCLVQVPLPTAQRIVSITFPSAEGVPVVVLDATFIFYEDATAGSDCARLLANEYTRVQQRPSATYLKEALDGVSAIASRFKAGERKYKARRDEIFRCITEGTPSTILASASPVPAAVPDAGTCASFHHRGAPTVGSRSQGGSRVPYYLRRQTEGPAVMQNSRGGVVIPPTSLPVANVHGISTSAAVHTESSCTRLSRECVSAFHYYGNIIQLQLCREYADQATVYTTLYNAHEPLVSSPPFDPSPSTSAYFRIAWQYGPARDDCMSATIRGAQVLEALLGPVLPSHKMCSMVVDEHNMDFSLWRTDLLCRWRAAGTACWWWKLLAESVVVKENGAPSMGDALPHALWLESEWTMVLGLLKTSLANALYKFTVKGTEGVIEKVFLVAEGCCVSGLF